MELAININGIEKYRSPSQRVRFVTERWFGHNVYCPNCGHFPLTKLKNNHPAGDFSCPDCKEEFELKSKKGFLGTKITDGAYETLIHKIIRGNAPHLFLLAYSAESSSVKDLIVVPSHFFTQRTIEKRAPLKRSARRAGWVGCNILLNQVPNQGKLYLISNSQVVGKESVLRTWRQSRFLKTKPLEERSWFVDVLDCLDKITEEVFTLQQFYQFEEELQKLHPNNRFIRAKIRQQLQVLRDQGYIEFLARGKYRKLQ